MTICHIPLLTTAKEGIRPLVTALFDWQIAVSMDSYMDTSRAIVFYTEDHLI
jgi:hypothetical protein